MRFEQAGLSLEQQLDHERKERLRLAQEAEQLRRRLTSLRGVVEVLRGKLARERADRSVLAARLLDRQAELFKVTDVSRLDELKIENIRTTADIYEEHDKIRRLVRAIYQSIAGKGPVPDGLDLLEDLPPEPPDDDEEAESPAGTGWRQFLIGKIVGRTLQTADGRVIAQEGERITAEGLAAAAQEGLLLDLTLAMRVPITDADL